MAGYTFYFTRADRDIPDFDFADCDGDEQALALAERELKRRLTAQAVEVFSGESVVGKIEARTQEPAGRRLGAAS
jgi:hypothetical protein